MEGESSDKSQHSLGLCQLFNTVATLACKHLADICGNDFCNLTFEIRKFFKKINFRGTFRMEREDGYTFDCRIPPFSLESKPEGGPATPPETV